MLTSVLTLIFQIMKHGIYGLALLADRVFHILALRHAVVEVDKVEEVACIGKAILHKTLDNAMPHVYQLLIAMCLTPLYLVKGVEQHAAAEAYLHLARGFAIVGKDGMT